MSDSRIKRGSTSGFTLVELLVVVAIIALLVTISFPSLSRALQLAYKARTVGFISSLTTAAQGYKKDYYLYPGQKYPEVIYYRDDGTATPSANDQFLPGQVLAACVFGFQLNYGSPANAAAHPGSPAASMTVDIDTDGTIEACEGAATNAYLAYSVDKVIDPDDADKKGYARYDLSDQWSGDPGARRMLYWAGIPGVKGEIVDAGLVTSPFVWTDNADGPASDELYSWNKKYSNGESPTEPDKGEDEWAGFIENTNSTLSGTAFNYDSFLLIAPGLDRLFDFSTTGDDLTNFSMDK